MPTYEYGCEACGKKWEAEQRITEAPIKKCPKCGKLKAKRLISGGTFMLKGGGWYADGYGSSKKSSGSSDGEKSKPKAETKSEAKADAKAGTKSDASSKSASGASDS